MDLCIGVLIHSFMLYLMLLQVAQIYKQKINYQLLEKDLSCPDFMYYPSIYLENT